jgi:hypothetical protein
MAGAVRVGLQLDHLPSPGAGVVMMMIVMRDETEHGSCLIRVAPDESTGEASRQAPSPDLHISAIRAT